MASVAQTGAWRQISLRMMFVVMTLMGCYLGYHANIVHGRRKVLNRFRDKQAVQFHFTKDDPFFDPAPARIPLVRRLMGDVSVSAIHLHRYTGQISPEEAELLQHAFPEAEIGEVYMVPAVPASN